MVKAIAGDFPNFKEQLHALDKDINSSPAFSNLHPKNLGINSVGLPMFSHDTSAQASLNLTKNEVRREVDSLEAIWVEEFIVGWTSNFNDKETACVSQTSLNLNKNEVRREVDSLVAIRAIKFNVG